MTEATFSTHNNGDRIRDRFVVYASTGDYNRNWSVFIGTVDYNDRTTGVVAPLIVEAVGPDYEMSLPTPTMYGPLAKEFLQASLDEAWRMGLRPKNWRDERPGEIKAMNDHLQDMRRLVFRPSDPLESPLETSHAR